MTSNDEEIPSTETDLKSIADFVAQLSAHMREQGLTSLTVEIPEARIRLRSQRKKHGGAHKPTPMLEPIDVENDDETTSDTPDDGIYIEAPMIGTFYAAAGPGESAFVAVGDSVEVGQTIAIIEAMKIMNEIVADHAGVVAEILVQNAEAVEYGQPLFRLTSNEA